MINRYDVPEVSSLWHEEKKFEYFLKVEMSLLEALRRIKTHSKSFVSICRSKN